MWSGLYTPMRTLSNASANLCALRSFSYGRKWTIFCFSSNTTEFASPVYLTPRNLLSSAFVFFFLPPSKGAPVSNACICFSFSLSRSFSFPEVRVRMEISPLTIPTTRCFSSGEMARDSIGAGYLMPCTTCQEVVS